MAEATGVYRVGDPAYSVTNPYDPRTTRYVQMKDASGAFYDRKTGTVGAVDSSGKFTALVNQTKAKSEYITYINAVNAVGPFGEPSVTPRSSVSAGLLGTPEDITIADVVPIVKPKVVAGATGADILRYPSAREMTKDTDYVSFEFFEYEPPFGRGRSGGGTATVTEAVASGYKLYQGNRGAEAKDAKPILLYMPEDIQTQFSARWGGTGFGATFAGLARVMGTSVDANALKTAAEGIPGALKTGFFKVAVDAINKGLGSSVTENQLLGSVTGTVINPNTEMLYEAPDLRNFNLTFKMTPHDGREAIMIRRICQRFKKALLPKFGGQALFGAVESAPNLITIPYLCQVTFMKGDSVHPSLPQYKLCAITNVDVNYTPDGSYATFGDAAGTPVATSLTVAFKETKIIFRDEIVEEGVSY